MRRTPDPADGRYTLATLTGQGQPFSVSQTTFADPEDNQFDLVRWQQQPE